MAKKKQPDRRAPTASEVLHLYKQMSSVYSQRNQEFTVLRQVFDAQYVSTQQQSSTGKAEFNDKKKLVYNMINTAVRRFMDEMSSPLRMQAIPRGIDDKDIEIAEKRQKAIDRCFEENQMGLKIIQAAYYQSLLDKAIWEVTPDPMMETKVRIDLTLPEAYFPIPAADNWTMTKAVLVSWKRFDPKESIELNDIDPLGQNQDNVNFGEDRVIEYSDDQWFVRWEKGEITVAIHHKMGFVRFDEAHNIPIPHRHRGQGDADQSVGLNEYLNELMSAQANVLAYLAAPIIVVRGSRTGAQNLVWGPGAIWEMERDGSAEILTWAGAPPTFEAQILRTMQGIEDNTGLSSPAFGREIPSGVSGETVRSILAGFNTRVGTKQTLMGFAIVSVAKKVQKIWETQFPNEEIEISGEQEGMEEGATLDPKEMRGFYDVRAIFEPQNETVRVFTELQKMEKGVQSKLRTMRNLGVANPEDEMKRIDLERQKEMAMQAQANMLAGGGQIGFDPSGQFGPQAPPQANPQVPFNASGLPEQAQAVAQSNPSPGEELVPEGTNTNSQPVQIRDILDLVGDEDLQDKAFLAGEIVKEGITDGSFELIATNPTDAQRLREALGPLLSRAKISVKDKQDITGEVIPVARSRTPRRG